ncbi:hypothetical protein Bca52824_022581 [Brassica carinata]|uniref:Uncharacterized protein n=1 Tax=Brassica carinata TaxID=52824 RepID=A0A8X7VGM1_BRACI|nr:hypothetical protein Bca52824_022581 [Brassica carinata]
MGEREMDFRGSRHKGKGKAKESIVLCDCGLPAKKAQSWTDENCFQRFYGCERYKTTGLSLFNGSTREALMDGKRELYLKLGTTFAKRGDYYGIEEEHREVSKRLG